jgi:hypothetical protein
LRVHCAVIGAVNILAVKDVIARTATNAICTRFACKSIITRAPASIASSSGFRTALLSGLLTPATVSYGGGSASSVGAWSVSTALTKADPKIVKLLNITNRNSEMLSLSQHLKLRACHFKLSKIGRIYKLKAQPRPRLASVIDGPYAQQALGYASQ